MAKAKKSNYPLSARAYRLRNHALEQDLESMTKQLTEAQKPVPMLMSCPICGFRHIDEGKFAEVPHHTHACQRCGFVWRPALVWTIGVRFLPGFKNG